MTAWTPPDLQHLGLIWALVSATQHLFKGYRFEHSPACQPPVTAIFETPLASTLPTGSSKTFEALHQVSSAGCHALCQPLLGHQQMTEPLGSSVMGSKSPHLLLMLAGGGKAALKQDRVHKNSRQNNHSLLLKGIKQQSCGVWKSSSVCQSQRRAPLRHRRH